MVWTSPAVKGLYLESAGKKACAMGYHGKGLEVWSYPMKLISDFRETLVLPEKKIRLELDDYAHLVEIFPHATMIHIAHPLFTIEKEIFTPIESPGCFIRYRIDSSTPVQIGFSFLPALNLMWPGSIGGQDCYWVEEAQGFILAEPTRSYSGLIRMEGALLDSKMGDHAFSDESYRMIVNLSSGNHQKTVCVWGFMGHHQECLEQSVIEESLFESSFERAKAYYEEYLARTVQLETPNGELNRFFSWAKLSLHKGEVDNPLLGKGLVAGIGPSGRSTRPGFDWYFAGDMSMNALGMVGYNDFATIRTSLLFFAGFQKEDGRIPHEISQSAPLIDWFGRYSGFAYLHADTTAYYLLALAFYVVESGDSSILSELEAVIEKALTFCDNMSEEETGMILNQKAGLGALEIGPHRKPKYDIYTNSIWAAALAQLSQMYRSLTFVEKADLLHQRHEKVCRSMEGFWWEEGSRYCLSIMPDQKQLPLLMAMAFFPISFGLLDKDRAKRFLKLAKESSLWVPWGVRSIEEGPEYDPIHYNFGSVWYFFNGFFSRAAYDLGDHSLGFSIIHAAVQAFFHENSTHMPELFSGDRFAAVTTAVPHQLFSLGPVIWAILSGMLGIQRNALLKSVGFTPQFPLQWDRLTVKNLQVGPNQIHIRYKRESSTTQIQIDGQISEPFDLVVHPRPFFLGSTFPQGQEGSLIQKRIQGPTNITYHQTGFSVDVIPNPLPRGTSKKQPKLLETIEGKDQVTLRLYGYKDSSIALFVVGDPVHVSFEGNSDLISDQPNGTILIPFSETGHKTVVLKKKNPS